MDYAGSAGLAPDLKVIAGHSAASLSGSGGHKTLAVDTARESFVRTSVLDAAGNAVAFSNPAWLLRKQPPGGIPGPRQV